MNAPIKWNFSALTAKDFIDISTWHNSTDIPEALAQLMIIAQSCADKPLSLSDWGEVLKEFIEAVNAYQIAQAEAKYRRRKGKP
jgi:hypothetical protein